MSSLEAHYLYLHYMVMRTPVLASLVATPQRPGTNLAYHPTSPSKAWSVPMETLNYDWKDRSRIQSLHSSAIDISVPQFLHRLCHSSALTPCHTIPLMPGDENPLHALKMASDDSPATTAGQTPASGEDRSRSARDDGDDGRKKFKHNNRGSNNYRGNKRKHNGFGSKSGGRYVLTRILFSGVLSYQVGSYADSADQFLDATSLLLTETKLTEPARRNARR